MDIEGQHRAGKAIGVPKGPGFDEGGGKSSAPLSGTAAAARKSRWNYVFRTRPDPEITAPCLSRSVFDDELTLPLTRETGRILESLPRDARVFELFEPVADEAFQQLLLEREDDVAFQRFVECLRLLLYHDGRNELALRIADLAHQNPSRSAEGVNAFAALANYYRRGASRLATDELLARLERYRGNAILAHNAAECQRQVRKKEQ